jgi:hypothetical protein
MSLVNCLNRNQFTDGTVFNIESKLGETRFFSDLDESMKQEKWWRPIALVSLTTCILIALNYLFKCESKTMIAITRHASFVTYF